MTEDIKPEVGNGRDEKGRLLPGFTANPNGRPKRPTFREYFTQEEEADLINKIKQALDKPDIMKMTIEHIFGKPKQPITGGDEDDKPIKIDISEKIADKNKLYDSPRNSE